MPPELFLPSTRPTASLNTPTDNKLSIQCDGRRFGYNPNLADCLSAKGYLPEDNVQRSWAERHTRQQRIGDFPLPYRSMGGKCFCYCKSAARGGFFWLTTYTDRALCYYQAMLETGQVIAHASVSQIGSAVNALILGCVTGSDSQGGIARGIG